MERLKIIPDPTFRVASFMVVVDGRFQPLTSLTGSVRVAHTKFFVAWV